MSIKNILRKVMLCFVLAGRSFLGRANEFGENCGIAALYPSTEVRGHYH